MKGGTIGRPRLPEGKRRGIVAGVRFRDEEMARLKVIAEENNTTVSRTIWKAVVDGLQLRKA